MFDKTNEQIIKRKKSLKLQKIAKINVTTINLKKRELFNFIVNYLLFRIS